MAGATLEKAERPEGLPSPRAFLAAKVADSQHRGPYRSVEWWCSAAADALDAWHVANHEHNGALVQFLDPSRRSRPLQDVLPEVLTVLGAEMSELSERRELLAAAARAKREEDTKQAKQFLGKARKHKSQLVESLWDVDDVVPTVGEFVDTYSPRLWRATRDQAWRAVNRNRVAPRRKTDQHDEDGDAVVKSRPPKGLIDSTVIVEAINHERSESESWSRLDFAREHSETLAVLLRHGADCVYRHVPSPVVDRLLWRVDMTGAPLEEAYWLNKPGIRLNVFVCATAWAAAIEDGSWGRKFDERVKTYLKNYVASRPGIVLSTEAEEQARIKVFKFVLHEFLEKELKRFNPDWSTAHLYKEKGRYSFHVTYLLSQLCSTTEGMEQTGLELDRLLAHWKTGGG